MFDLIIPDCVSNFYRVLQSVTGIHIHFLAKSSAGKLACWYTNLVRLQFRLPEQKHRIIERMVIKLCAT